MCTKTHTHTNPYTREKGAGGCLLVNGLRKEPGEMEVTGDKD